ncbi:hypothetical protein QCE81_25130 [Caballeronia sp. LZ002]|nr:hypothetical protein [Caballeronia sp. LZ002]
MNLDSKLSISLKKRAGNVVLRRDLSGLASASHLSTAIQHQIDDGRLVRLGAGIFAKAVPDSAGKARLAVRLEILLLEVFDKLGVHVIGLTIRRERDRAVCLVDIGTNRTQRKLGWDGIQVQYVVRPRAETDVTKTPGLPANIDELPTQGVASFVERLAKSHGIEYRRSGLDDFAEAVTRAAGDDVDFDLTGKLLVLLKKNDIVNARQFARLMTNHLKEVRRVRPVRGLRDGRLSA